MMLSEEKEKWIEVRRKTITDYFDVPQSEQGKIDAVFNDMAEIANRCANQGEFEQELLKSPVNTAYNNLFAGIAKYAKMPGGSHKHHGTGCGDGHNFGRGEAEGSQWFDWLACEFAPIVDY